MRTMIKKWGNSAGIRIPNGIIEKYNMPIDSEVEMIESKGRIVIKPINKKFELDNLLNEINTDNLHNEISFGASVGNEIE